MSTGVHGILASSTAFVHRCGILPRRADLRALPRSVTDNITCWLCYKTSTDLRYFVVNWLAWIRITLMIFPLEIVGNHGHLYLYRPEAERNTSFSLVRGDLLFFMPEGKGIGRYFTRLISCVHFICIYFLLTSVPLYFRATPFFVSMFVVCMYVCISLFADDGEEPQRSLVFERFLSSYLVKVTNTS